MEKEIYVECITQEKNFRDLAESWRQLFDNGGAQSIFLRYEWFDAAWQWAKNDSECWIIVVRKNNTLIGLCPLVRRRAKSQGLAMRKLEFLTVPDTQLCDLIVAPERAEEVAQVVARFLTEHKNEWDMIELRLLPSDSVAARYLLPALKDACVRAVLETSVENPWIDLRQGWDAFYAGRSRSLKKKNNLIANRLRKAGQIEIEWARVEPQNQSDYTAAVQIAIDLSAKSWKQETGNSLDQVGPNAFITRLSEHAATSGWLSIWLLRLDGKPLAMEYQLIDSGNIYALRADFDSACPSDLSPGSYLNMHLLEQHFQAGLSQYCMGPGDNPYKYRWADRTHVLHRLTGYSPTLKGRLLALLELVVKPRLRTWLKRNGKHANVSKEENE